MGWAGGEWRPMKLVVVIPAWNEAPTIGDVVRRVPRAIGGISQTEVLVVDDGSGDSTAELACQAGACVISHPTCARRPAGCRLCSWW